MVLRGQQEICGCLEHLGVAKDAAVSQTLSFDVGAVLDVVTYHSTEFDRGVRIIQVVENQGWDRVGFGQGRGAIVVEVIAVDGFDVVHQALLDLGVEAHDVAEQMGHR